jgi:3-phenylpropionate/cinnamic acid dioxygenase small subunit
MVTRIHRLRHPRIHAQTPPSRTARIVANPVIENRLQNGGGYLVRSKFILYEYCPSLPDVIERVLGGTYSYHFAVGDTGFKITMKKATLVSYDGWLSPMSVYFCGIPNVESVLK